MGYVSRFKYKQITYIFLRPKAFESEMAAESLNKYTDYHHTLIDFQKI
jgi:hypothetical protein